MEIRPINRGSRLVPSDRFPLGKETIAALGALGSEINLKQPAKEKAQHAANVMRMNKRIMGADGNRPCAIGKETSALAEADFRKEDVGSFFRTEGNPVDALASSAFTPALDFATGEVAEWSKATLC